MRDRVRHHPIFRHFEPVCVGHDDDYEINFLGVRTRRMFWTGGDPVSLDREGFPVPDEEYLEWLAVLEAVTEAQTRFVMVELGAGWGRWLVNAAAALRRSGDIPYYLVGVEAEPTHFNWMRQHMLDNDIDLDHVELLHAAVAAEDGVVWFHMGQPDAWYGQAIASGVEIPKDSEQSNEAWTPPVERTIRAVRSLSLATIIAGHERIDLTDLDIQGTEADVLESSQSELAARVRRVHIATHSAENEARVRALFGTLGWLKINDYASGHEYDTPYGRIAFNDGVQTWRNAKLH
jgi:FkbM family methyltransferase